MTVIIPKQNAVFLHIPKTAGSSIRDWLTTNIKSVVDLHPGHRTYEELGNTIPSGATTFCCVRNPFERAVSAYQYKKMKSEKSNKLFAKKYPTFESNVINRDKERNVTWKAQYLYAERCQIVLKFENLIEDFKQIQTLLDCYEPLPHSNKTVYSNWKSYYTPELERHISNIFSKDFELFNYSRNIDDYSE